MFRLFNAVFAVAAIAALAWVLSRPTKAECVATGRVVDPTERHCVSPTGYQQLEEHAWFHAREVTIGAVLLWLGAFALHRRSVRRTPRAPRVD